MATFKVGDNVKIIDSQGLFPMHKVYVGQVATITNVVETVANSTLYVIDRDGSNKLWSDTNLELLQTALATDDDFIKDIKAVVNRIWAKVNTMEESINDFETMISDLQYAHTSLESKKDRLLDEISELESILEGL
jgi:peptidoglycan hydrolase CwlO-like protein